MVAAQHQRQDERANLVLLSWRAAYQYQWATERCGLAAIERFQLGAHYRSGKMFNCDRNLSTSPLVANPGQDWLNKLLNHLFNGEEGKGLRQQARGFGLVQMGHCLEQLVSES